MVAKEITAVHPEVVDFVYTIKGDNELDLFELVLILSALGEVIQEGNRILNPDAGEIRISVKPFEEGSFSIESLLSLDHLNTLYAAYQAGGAKQLWRSSRLSASSSRKSRVSLACWNC